MSTELSTTAAAVGHTVGHVRYVSMERGETRNALSNEMKEALVAELLHYERDDVLRVMILSGCDCGAFSAGGDLRRVAGRLRAGLPVTDPDAPDVFGVLTGRTKPIIAAIDGYALGGGFEMALAADIRVATERSQFGLPEPRSGLLGQYGLDHLSRAIPLGEALRLQLTGGRIGAARAHTIGLVQELAADRDELFAKAEELATEITRCAPAAVRAIRRVVTVGRDLPSQYAVEFSRPYREEIERSADALEGVSAFLEKRQPSWVPDQ